MTQSTTDHTAEAGMTTLREALESIVFCIDGIGGAAVPTPKLLREIADHFDGVRCIENTPGLARSLRGRADFFDEQAAAARKVLTAPRAPAAVPEELLKAARDEYARWSTGRLTHGPAETRNWVCRKDDQGVFRGTTAHASEMEAASAMHEQALNAALRTLAAAPAAPPAEDDAVLLRLQLADAREGERRWALRCGYVLDRSEFGPTPADIGRLAYDTMRTAASGYTSASPDRWDDLSPAIRQRWACVEGACIDRARVLAAPPADGGTSGHMIIEATGALMDAEWALTIQWPDGTETVELVSDNAARVLGYRSEESGGVETTNDEAFASTPLASPTPAGAAGDPVGAALTDDEMQAACEACWSVARSWIAEKQGRVDPGEWSDQSALMQTVTRAELREAFATVAKLRVTRPASSAPAASAGGEPVAWGYDFLIAPPKGEWVFRVLNHRPVGTPSRRNIRPLYEATLAPTAQAQPAGRDEIVAAAMFEHDERERDPKTGGVTWAQWIEHAEKFPGRSIREIEGYRSRARAVLAILDARPVADGGAEKTFQARCQEWLDHVCQDDPTDLPERIARFYEEATEWVQSLGFTAAEAQAIQAYTFGRKPGHPPQEIGGMLTTAAVLAKFIGQDIMACGEAELARCWQPEVIAKVRQKRANRHGRGPLPGDHADLIPTPATAPAAQSTGGSEA